MGYKGGPCWYCGMPLDNIQSTPEFDLHMGARCPDQERMARYLGSDTNYPASAPNPCGMSATLDGRRFVCSQKTHPSGKHNGKAWNAANRTYDFVSWNVYGDKQIA